MTKLPLLLFIILLCNAFSQNSKLQFAKSYFEAGQYEDASRIYKELYDSDNKNFEYFSGLAQSYNYLNKHKELIPIVEKQLKFQYNSLLDVFLGELFLKVEGKEKALKHWQDIVKNNKDDANIYLAVSEAMTVNKLFAEAIEVLSEGKKRQKLSTYDEKLIKLYITTNDYKLGSKLVIDNLMANKDLIKAEGHFYAFMTSKESKDYLKTYLLKLSDDNQNDIYIQELIAWYFRTIDDLASAFDVYVRLDKLKNTGGREIYSFADLSRKDGYYKEALKAYETIMSNSNYERYKRSAIFGYALTLEEQLKTNDKVSKEQATNIINRYSQLVDKNQSTNESIEAAYRIAMIKKKWLKDFKGANSDLSALISKYPRLPISTQAGLQLGINYMEMGDLEQARNTLQDVKTRLLFNNQSLESQVDYQLANSIYYSGKIDSAKVLFSKLTDDVRDDISNDAMEKLLIFDENTDFPDALKSYAQADYSVYKKDFSSAKEEFLNIYKTYPKTKISDRSAIEYAEILFEEKEFVDCAKFLEEFRFSNMNSIFSDKALILLADSYYLSGNSEKAIEKLKEILIDYSNTIYIQEVRDKLRKYRGDI